MTPEDLEALHLHWFGPAPDPVSPEQVGLWFMATPEQEAQLAVRFRRVLDSTPSDMGPDGLTPRQRLGLILLLDQLPRTFHRGTPDAYARDPQARALTRALLADGLEPYAPGERVFAILPLGHSEDLADQDAALAAFAQWVRPVEPPDHFFFQAGRRQSQLYRDIIARFGRFPFRNDALGRETTPEEAEFLATTKLTPF